MIRLLTSVTLALWVAMAVGTAFAKEAPAKASQGSKIVWHDDYQQGMQAASAAKKMMFVYFHDKAQNVSRQRFESTALANSFLAPWADRYIWVRLPVDATITVQGKPVRLLGHAAFREMLGRSGIAVVDLESKSKELYGRVVTTIPFNTGKYPTPASTTTVRAILGLPKGTLTQRTMIFAVRIHPEGPASTHGQPHPVLHQEATSHSSYQASLGVQGHHSWDSRFQRINGRVGGTAQEVVAESWPNENLLEACVDCVDSWRQSPGHWSAVRSQQRMFGYDIRRGMNGIWYATGIFAR